MYRSYITYRQPSSNNDNGKSCHVILTEPTNAKTFASIVLLNDYYRGLEVDYFSKKYNINIFDKPEYKNLSNYTLLKVIRQISQRKFLEKSNLICHYCDKPVKLSNGKTSRSTATVDHFVSQKEHCDPFDETNYRVCCSKCNNEKGELTYQEWMQKKKI